MATRKTCDKCKNYTAEENNQGGCALMGDSNDGNMAIDRCAGWDYEWYGAGVYVGPKFGCIHWAKVDQHIGHAA